MKENPEAERIDTTLGDLIVAVSDAALEVCDDQRRAYLLAALALHEILNNAPLRAPDITENLGELLTQDRSFH